MHVYDDWSKSFTKSYNNSIGNGAFGKVWLVRSNINGRYYAMKEINLNQYILKCSLINKAYALDEGIKLRKLGIKHPNVCRYYQSFLTDDYIYWIMDYCDGGTLKDRLVMYIKQELKLDQDLVWYWSLQILNGLKYLHNKCLIHRDLKPDNIYISLKDGSCKIGDFGLSKVLTNTSINENTVIRYSNFDDENDSTETNGQQVKSDIPVVYKLINLSQVGTPSYMSFEMRNLIEAHLNHCSINSVGKALLVCEKNLYKGDIFSYACVLYEMIFLKVAFDNKFRLPDEAFAHVCGQIDSLKSSWTDIKRLFEVTMTTDPNDRLNIDEIFQLDFIKSRSSIDYSTAYRKQVIPHLNINSKFAKQNVLECIKVKLDSNYKPATMKTLKFNQNLIVIVANKHVNMQKNRNSGFKVITSTLNNLSPFNATYAKNIEEAMLDEDDYFEESIIFIYNEYGQLIKEFNSFMANETDRQMLNFKVYDFCVDEVNDHMYLSTKQHGILRFEVRSKNFYFEDIIFNGRLDLSELYGAQNISRCLPTSLNLIENEKVFADSMKTTGKRRLIFNDRLFKRIISIQVDLNVNNNNEVDIEASFEEKLNNNLIKCNINAGLTLDQRFLRQMVSTETELICLFDDLNLINIYDIKTLLLKRTNNKLVNLSARLKNSFCLAIDSYDALYSTDGECIFNLDYNEFKSNKRIRPLIKKGENLSHIISWMSILTNSKLVLLSDAVQMENSFVFILKPVSTTSLSASFVNKSDNSKVCGDFFQTVPFRGEVV